MKTVFSLILLLLFFNAEAQNTSTDNVFQPYVDYLENGSFPSAKEYIMSKFQSKDIVIISERDHRDLTQYDIIFDVLKDPDFTGNVYTEVGTFNSYKRINGYLLNDSSSASEAEAQLLGLYRDVDYEILWDKHNYYLLLKTIHQINATRDKEDKILLWPLDVKFDWSEIESHGEFAQFDEHLEDGTIDRDLQMGKHFTAAYEYTKQRNPDRTKALVILNTYHGYIRIPAYLPLPGRPEVYSAAQYIYKTYPEITTNIYVNYFTQSFSSGLSNNGVIDAAFQVTGTDNVGFDLEDTPFGESKFDLYNFGGTDYETVSFQFIFDGMIYYKPVSEFQLGIGIPNVYPKELEKQFYERISLIEGISLKEAKLENREYYQEINNLNISEYNEEQQKKIKEQIEYWLK